MTKTFFQSPIWRDIRFWILLFFALRLFGITLPPLEVNHNWRQTTVTMVARNFYEIDANILYPRIDIAGEKTGITGMEFPILNYLIYLVSLVFGYEHWYGRLINLIVSSFGVWYFFRLIKLFFAKPVAFNSSIILLGSVWFSYSRKIMPDTFSVSLVLFGLFYAFSFLQNPKKHIFLLWAFLGVCFGVLSKLPAGYLLVLLALPVVQKALNLLKSRGQIGQNHWSEMRPVFLLTGVLFISILPAIYWYFSWVPYLVETFGFWHFFMGTTLAEGAKEIASDLLQTAHKFYEIALKWIGFFVFLFGFVWAIAKKEKRILWVFGASFGMFMLVVLKSGESFPNHDYYIIPFVPAMALVCGYALFVLPFRKFAFILLIAIPLEGILNQVHDFRIRPNQMALAELESVLDKLDAGSTKIAINSSPRPTPMYLAHRKGWLSTNEQLHQQDYLDSLQTLGLKNVVVLKEIFGENTDLDLPLLFENGAFKVYSVVSPVRQK